MFGLDRYKHLAKLDFRVLGSHLNHIVASGLLKTLVFPVFSYGGKKYSSPIGKIDHPD
jgi:hypothetical protein